MNKFSTLERSYPLKAWRMFGWLIVALIIVFVAWINYAELEEVAVLSGEIVPQNQVKTIQHLEGGIIKKIYVKDGSLVKKDDPLMQLDLAVNAINEEGLKIQLAGIQIKRARLVGESEGNPPKYPIESQSNIHAVLKAEKNVHKARIAQVDAKIRILKEKARQKKLDVDQLRIKLSAISSDMEVSQRKFAMSKELLAANLTPKIEHLQLETELTRLTGEVNTLRPAIPRAKAAASEVQAKISEERLNFRREAQEELSEIEVEIARLKELLITAVDQVTRTTIRSPIDGIVKNVRNNTIGGIVRPSDAVMDIVPSSDKLVVEAKLSPSDRGFVEVGQDVTVKLTAYDFFTYGGLRGKIANIAADSTVEKDGQTFFKIIVETEKEADGGMTGMLVSPGMQAMVDVHTGKKPVLQYLLQPVLRLRHESFRER
ncbi:MAG: HlyD family type I secretion periplasmic adaptor subunit [Pseudomonas marincola]